MKILFVNGYFAPELIAYSHLEKDLIEELVRQGHTIDVICPIPSRGISFEEAEKYKTIRAEALYNGRVTVQRFWSLREGKNPIIRAFRYLWCNIREYQIGRTKIGVDVIFSVSTPPTQGMLCGMIKRCLKVPFVYCIQDIFPDSLVNAKMTHVDSLIWKIGRKIENCTYRYADRIIAISEAFKRNIIAKGVPEDKIAVVPNWVNIDSVYSVERKDNVLFERYGLDRAKYYICYSGNIGHSQNLELLLEAAEQLQTIATDIQFVLIGEGVAKGGVEQKIAERAIRNITMLPFQPYEDIANVFSLGDIDLIISKPGVGGSSVPSKTWSIMAAERPILASFDMDSELCRLVDEIGCGKTVDPYRKEALVAAIIEMHGMDCSGMGRNGRKYVKEYLDKDCCTRAYVDTIKRVAKNDARTE